MRSQMRQLCLYIVVLTKVTVYSTKSPAAPTMVVLAAAVTLRTPTCLVGLPTTIDLPL